jgi:hypothetical protein
MATIVKEAGHFDQGPEKMPGAERPGSESPVHSSAQGTDIDPTWPVLGAMAGTAATIVSLRGNVPAHLSHAVGPESPLGNAIDNGVHILQNSLSVSVWETIVKLSLPLVGTLTGLAINRFIERRRSGPSNS